MTEGTGTSVPEEATGNPRLAILLAMAMFVLVVDTSLMNVSISAVVRDLDTTVSGVQSAIALEALVSAAFILIGSKVGDLIGRKRAYVLGLLAYAIGALSMALAQGLTAIIVFWAIVGGLGASLLLPAMQSLIHGNFEGAAQKKAYALVGAAAAIAAAVGPLLGGFITTYLSWRVAFLLEDVVIAIVLIGIRLVRDVPYTGPRRVDAVGALLSVLGMGGIVLGILVWQEGGESVAALLAIGAISLGAFVYWLVRRKRHAEPTLLDPDLFRSSIFRYGISEQMLQQIALGGTMIALPIFLQMVLEYNAMQAGLSLAPLSLSMFGMALLAAKKAGARRPSSIIRLGFALLATGMVALIPIVPRAESGWYLVVPLLIAGCGLGLLVSQLNNYTLSPISDERVSEAAGVNSAAGSFGLSFGLAFAGAIMLATLSITFTNMAEASSVLSPTEQQRVSEGLEDDAEVLSNTQLEELLVRPAPGHPGRDPAHQHRRQTSCPSGGAPRSAPRRPRRVAQRVPHDAPTRPHTIELCRRDGRGLTSHHHAPRHVWHPRSMAQQHGECHHGNAGGGRGRRKDPARRRRHRGHPCHERSDREELDDGDDNCTDPGGGVGQQIQPSEQEHARRQHRGREDRAAIDHGTHDLAAPEGLGVPDVSSEELGKDMSQPGRQSDSRDEFGAVAESDLRDADHTERGEDEHAAVAGRAHQLCHSIAWHAVRCVEQLLHRPEKGGLYALEFIGLNLFVRAPDGLADVAERAAHAPTEAPRRRHRRIGGEDPPRVLDRARPLSRHRRPHDGSAPGGSHWFPVCLWNALTAWVIVGKKWSGSIVFVSS